MSGDSAAVPPGVDLSAYRIVQEALTNVLKHAGPTARATVRIDYEPEHLEIVVQDNGTADSLGNGHGHGLIGIRERAAVLGGYVAAGPEESGGFTVRAHLPYAAQP